MSKWPIRKKPNREGSGVFSPFSKQAKAWEPHAQKLRLMAGCGPDDLLDPYKLAPRLQLTLMDGDEVFQLLPPELQRYLRTEASDHWSGGVLPHPLPDGTYICILNPRHPRRRNKITLMEEIAHRHMKHRPSKVVADSADVKARDFDKACETEAFGIGAAALLPWPQMFGLLNTGNSASDIAEHFDVSLQLVEYRIKITGASRLYLARRRAG
jgi:IrrE N-terminal-like domain